MSSQSSEHKAVSTVEHQQRDRGDTPTSEQQRPDVQRQMVFAEDGKIEPEEGPIGTSLEDYGAEVDHRERTTRIDEPSASEFGVDDRPEVTKADTGGRRGCTSWAILTNERSTARARQGSRASKIASFLFASSQ